jgi:uncharacterized damage-inducible protein DinB
MKGRIKMDQHTALEPERSHSDIALVALFRHNLWANLRLLDACTALDEQQLAATTSGTFGTIYNTLRHIVGAENSYLSRLTGQAVPFNRDDTPDLATLRRYALHAGEGLIKVAAQVTPSDVVHLEREGQSWSVPASLILTQAINHATEHRAQIMTILTQQGIQPPDLSGWSYMVEHIPPEPGELPQE